MLPRVVPPALSRGLLAGLGVAALLLVACNGDAPESDRADGRPLRVVTTIGQIADAVRRVGGDAVEVHALMGPGVDPHLYRASESDITRLESADVVFWNGLHLEAGMTGVLERMEDLGVRSVRVTDGIDRGQLLAPPEFDGAYDPHVWFDLDLWTVVVASVRDALVDMDPDRCGGLSSQCRGVHRRNRRP